MATATRRLLPTLLKTLGGTGAGAGSARGLSTEKAVGAAAVVGTHTAKWMQSTLKKKKHPTREAPTGAALEPWLARSLKLPCATAQSSTLSPSSILTIIPGEIPLPSPRLEHWSAGQTTPPLASEPQLASRHKQKIPNGTDQ